MTDEDRAAAAAPDLSGLSIRDPESDLSLEQAEAVVLRWENGKEQQQQMVWEISSEEAAEYLRAVDRLQAESDQRARKALGLAAARLRNEFKHLLAVHTESVDSSWLPDSFSAPSFSSTTADPAEDDHNASNESGETISTENPTSAREQSCIIDLLPPAIVSDLSDIAARMIRLGRSREVIDAYVTVRKGVLEQSLFDLGVERLSPEEIRRMQWEALEPLIKKFIKGLKVSIKVLFASEKFLCDEVFFDDPSGDECFGEMANEAAVQVLATFKACATAPGSPERLFRLLDMYETLKELLPEVDRTFTGLASVDVPREAGETLELLGVAVKNTFMELKSAIESDSSRTSVAGGAVHPLIRYVMNYLGFLSEYLDTLKELYGEDEDAGEYGGDETEELENETGGKRSILQTKLMLVLEALIKHVEDNSRLYKDQALSSVFLMNNTHYIVQKAKATEMQSVIGNSWLRKHSSLVRFHAMNYQRLAWGKIFSYLRDEGIRGSGFTVSREVLKERFRSFNTAFEEIHRTQSGWNVPELQLRDELRVLIADKLLPAYRSFLGRYRTNLEGVRHSERYLKYSAEDLEDHLNDLFEGSAGSMRRRSFSTG